MTNRITSLSKIITGLWPTTIRYQLIFGVALVHLLLMTFFVFDLVDRQRDFLKEQSLEQTKSLVETLALNSSSWVLANDVVGLEEIVLAIGQYPGLHYAMVITTDGKVLAHTDESHIGQGLVDEKSSALFKAEPKIQILHTDRNILDIAAPILTSTGTIVGWARIAQGQEKIADNLMIISRNGILYTLLAIAAGSLLAVLLGNRLTSGLNHLLFISTRFRDGHRDLRMEITRHDEIALLGVGFNSMLDSIVTNEELILLNQQRLERLADIFQFQATNQQELLDYALEQAILLTGSRLGYLCYYDEETQEFTLNSWSRETMQECAIAEPPTRFQLETCGLWGEAVRQRRAILINDFQAENPLKKGCPPGHVPLCNYLTIPVFQEKHIVAVVGVANKGKDYDQTDTTQLTLMMDAVWRLVERRHTEEALRESEEKYRSLFESSRDALMTLAPPSWAFISGNPATLQMFRVKDQEEFISSGPGDLSPERQPDGRVSLEKAKEMIETAMRNGSHFFEWTHRRIGGEEFPAEVFLTRIESNEKVFLQATVRDITERKLAEQALAQAAQEWSAAMDASADVIYLLNLKRCIIRGNKAFYQATSISPETAVGRHIAEIVHPEGEAAPCPVCRAQEEKRDLQVIMEADDPNNPVDRPLEITVKIVRDQAQQPISILVTHHDLSAARKEMEEKLTLEKQLRQAQKMEAIGTLAGGIAHDFNNILSIIFGYTELAMEDTDPQSCRSHLEAVRKSAERAKELVKQILTFSRKIDQQQHPLQVSLVVKEALKMLRASIPTTIAIKQNITSNATVLADPTQIHQVIMNLCANAYHAMRETGGTLSVSLTEVEIKPQEYGDTELSPGKYLKLEVSDTGCGIDPKIKDKIFEPYFTTKKQGEGTGMGLAMVHGIAKNHHGHITFDSEIEKGTNIQLYLPILSDTAMELPSPTTPKNQNGTGERILFVDDEEQIRALTAAMLTMHGYQVTTAANGREAWEEFKKHSDHFHILITDMTMPEMTGAELAQLVLALKPKTPILLCTGRSDLINKEKALSMGITDYLYKPFNMQTFLEAIHSALKKG